MFMRNFRVCAMLLICFGLFVCVWVLLRVPVLPISICGERVIVRPM